MSYDYERMDEERANTAEESQTLVEFTDEEGYGKYLDLHECYDKYVNLKNIEVLCSLCFITRHLLAEHQKAKWENSLMICDVVYLIEILLHVHRLDSITFLCVYVSSVLWTLK